MIIERASNAAYVLPSVAIVSARCGERDGRGGAEKTGETFGLEDISYHCEQGNHQPADHKSEYKLRHSFTLSRDATEDIRKRSSSGPVHIAIQ